MVIPAVRIIVVDDDGRVRPIRRALEQIDHVHDERLFVDGIGVAGVAILESGSFQIAHGGHVASADGGVEIIDVVLMIRRIALLADHRGGSRARVS